MVVSEALFSGFATSLIIGFSLERLINFFAAEETVFAGECRIAASTMRAGGLALGEIMNPKASAGSSGRVAEMMHSNTGGGSLSWCSTRFLLLGVNIGENRNSGAATSLASDNFGLSGCGTSAGDCVATSGVSKGGSGADKGLCVPFCKM